MKRFPWGAIAVLFLILPVQGAQSRSPQGVSERGASALSAALAPTPPMGWNSYDCYGGDVNEREVKANADYMAEHLARYGWKYIVIDYYWYYPNGTVAGIPAMDRYGRLVPDPKRFPSSTNDQGFKPLADYVHSKGLKFGIHIMRGIPRAAVNENLPIFGTAAHARDAVNLLNTCSWSKAMYGVDASKPAGRAYYDSIARLYAQWGVDYIKADDMSQAEDPYGELYHGPEIAALRRAMTRTRRPMVLSLSPGPTSLSEAAHVEKDSQLWRISNDIWDHWQQVANQFGYCRLWARYSGPNHWPDADMLPLGRLQIRGFSSFGSFGKPHMTHLTHNEQRAMMTLWFIFRSPLMIGADLTSLDPFRLGLFTDSEALEVDQNSSGNHQLFAHGQQIAWVADAPQRAKYVALFNLNDSHSERMRVSWVELGLRGRCAVRDIWLRKQVGAHGNGFSAIVPSHGAGLYKIESAPDR